MVSPRRLTGIKRRFAGANSKPAPSLLVDDWNAVEQSDLKTKVLIALSGGNVDILMTKLNHMFAKHAIEFKSKLKQACDLRVSRGEYSIFVSKVRTRRHTHH
jgi:hypothetical protein